MLNDLSTRLAQLSPEKRKLLLKKLQKHRTRSSEKEITVPPRLTPFERGETIPLSFNQEQLWFLAQLPGGNVAYNLPAALKLSGKVRADIIERCLLELIRRHEVLRTTFSFVRGEPVQQILPELTIDVPIVDLRSMSETDRNETAQRLFREEARQPFNLERGPLVRATLYHMASHEYVLLFIIHHIVFDGWSIEVLFQEFSQLYEAFWHGKTSPLSEVPLQYADFSLWQRTYLQGEYLDDLLSYWKKELSGELPVLSVPTDYPNPSRSSFQGSNYRFLIPLELTQTLKERSQQEGASLFMILFAAFNVLLFRYSGQEELLLGFPSANRYQPEVQELVGFLANTLVLRTDMSGNPTFQELLRQIRQRSLEIQKYQALPLKLLVEQLQPERDGSRQPFFNVMFVYQNAPLPALKIADMKLEAMEIFNNTAKLDLALILRENHQGIEGGFEYSTELFRDETILRMAAHFQNVLESIVVHPEQRIATIPLLSDAERELLLHTWNKTDAEFPTTRCIHELVEEQALRTPDAVAATFNSQTLSYRELNERANQLAYHVIDLGGKPRMLVGICVERSFDMLVGILGILKAGCAYVPLDPAYPKERLAYIAEDAQLSIIVTQKHLLNILLGLSSSRVFAIDEMSNTTSPERHENIALSITPNDLAYIIYTSGSTGKPKGVLVAHRGLCNIISAEIEKFEVRQESRILQFVSLNFDVATSDIFMALCAGATLCLFSREDLLPGPGLTELLIEHEITHIEIPVSVLAAIPYKEIPSLQAVIAGGESCSRELVDTWGRTHKFFNAYGPTEATICTTVAECHQGHDKPPIGRPLANMRVYILDRSLQPVPIGVPGEMYIGGVGVAQGYLNRPELTAERFLTSFFDHTPGERLYKSGDMARYLPDGTIEFLGRNDDQVKIRGYRIELGEIETTLRQHEEIQDLVVLVEEIASQQKQLVAYVVPKNPSVPLTSDELHEFSKQRLPVYMVPSVFVSIDSIPLTPNGKVDRQALRALDTGDRDSGKERMLPRTAVERTLADIWKEALGCEAVGIHDDFFEIGGNSLLIVKVVTLIQEQFHVAFKPADLFVFRTIAKINEFLEGKVDAAEQRAMETIDFEREALLPEDIAPIIEEPDTSSPPSSILLTGATGFLGAFLLHELLHQTNAEIFCLIRSASPEEGRQRLQQILQRYMLWEERFESRIIPLSGDLSLPSLGLAREDVERISHQVDVIYHNGAFVNFIYPYQEMKAANVLGTQEIIRLACHIRSKPVHYVSSLSVFESEVFAGKTLYETDPLQHCEQLQSGYAQSKWVAEKLLSFAASQGVPVTIYRPGRISGHSRTGAWSTDDLACRMMKSCIQLQRAPLSKAMLEMAPVDYVSKTIVFLSQQVHALGQHFHVLNPQMILWNELIDGLIEFGYPIEKVPYERWLSMLKETSEISGSQGEENALKPLLPLFLESPVFPLESQPQHFDCRQTLSGLAGSSITCPPLNRELIHTYLSYFVTTGFLRPASL